MLNHINLYVLHALYFLNIYFTMLRSILCFPVFGDTNFIKMHTPPSKTPFDNSSIFVDA